MIKQDIFGKDVKAMFQASAKDRLHRFVMADGRIKGVVVHATRMVNEMRANHALDPLETLVLGQGYIACALMSSGLKAENDRLSLSINCSGPVKGLDIEANVYGEIRGFLKTSRIEVKEPGKIKYLSTLYGAGFLTVTKYLDDAARPYSGQVALEHGSIAEDLANYFLVSEQNPTGFHLSVFFDENEAVQGAGGIFLQAMPGADQDQVVSAEKHIQNIDSLGQLFAQGMDPETLVLEKFADLSPKMLSSNRVEFFCRCSKERMQGYLNTLPEADRLDIIKNGPFPLELRCHHCNSRYQFDREELNILRHDG